MANGVQHHSIRAKTRIFIRDGILKYNTAFGIILRAFESRLPNNTITTRQRLRHTHPHSNMIFSKQLY